MAERGVVQQAVAAEDAAAVGTGLAGQVGEPPAGLLDDRSAAARCPRARPRARRRRRRRPRPPARATRSRRPLGCARRRVQQGRKPVAGPAAEAGVGQVGIAERRRPARPGSAAHCRRGRRSTRLRRRRPTSAGPARAPTRRPTTTRSSVGQREQGRPHRHAADEVLGAVDRVDDPAPVAAGRRVVAELLAEQRVVRALRRQRRADGGLDRPVGVADRSQVGLGLDDQVERPEPLQRKEIGSIGEGQRQSASVSRVRGRPPVAPSRLSRGRKPGSDAASAATAGRRRPRAGCGACSTPGGRRGAGPARRSAAGVAPHVVEVVGQELVARRADRHRAAAVADRNARTRECGTGCLPGSRW